MKKLARGKVSGTVLLGVLFFAAGCGSKEEDSMPNYVVNKVQTGTTAGEPRDNAGTAKEAKAMPTGVLSIIQEDIAGELGKEDTAFGSSIEGNGQDGLENEKKGNTAEAQEYGDLGEGGKNGLNETEKNGTDRENIEENSGAGTKKDKPDKTEDAKAADATQEIEDELYVTGASDSLEEGSGIVKEEDGVDGAAVSPDKESGLPAQEPANEQGNIGNKEPVSVASVQELRLLAAGTAVDISAFSAEQTAACFSFEEVPDAVFERMKGKSYGDDCTVPLSQLRYVRVLHIGFDGAVHIGELVVNESIVQDIADIFQELFNAGYPIEKILLIDTYGGDDRASMADNNTSAFNYRLVDGTASLSKHALGLAVDVNPLYNPYIPEREGVPEVLPENASLYADRQAACEYYIRSGDLCYEAFVSRGFTWGGDWASGKDYKHFSKSP